MASSNGESYRKGSEGRTQFEAFEGQGGVHPMDSTPFDEGRYLFYVH